MSVYRKIITTGLVAVAAAATSLLAGPAHAASASTSGPLAAQPLNIAAIGDSFASGQGDKSSSGWINDYCYLSSLAAPQQAVALLNGVRPADFTTAACNGSVIEDPTDGYAESALLGTDGPNGQPLNNGQLSYVDPTRTDPVDALTISIGGNDIGFANIVTSCVDAFDNCTTDPNVTGIPGYGTVQSALQRLGPYPTDSTGAPTGRLGDLVKAVNARGDIDNVFLTAYPDPTIAPDGSRCGWGGAYPGFGGFDAITQPKAEWASGAVIAPLNAALASTVILANEQPGPHPVWHFVDLSGAFENYGFCAPDRYVNTIVDSELEQGDQYGAMHPNNAGQQAVASDLFHDYISLPLMSASVSATSSPVVQSSSNFTVQTLNFDKGPIPNAGVWVDGNFVGYTDKTGSLTFSHTFSTTGDHTIVARANGYPDAQAVVSVQTRPYVAASNLEPIPLKTSIPVLTLSAVDTANNQLVAGAFTLRSGSGTLTIQSGTTVDNVVVTILGYTTVTEVGPLGKPITVQVPICPSLTFQPASSDYAPQNFSTLVRC